MDTENVPTPGYDYGVTCTCMSVLHLYASSYNGIQSDFDQHNMARSTAWMVRQMICA